MVIFMKKRTMSKRCIAWVLTLVMVLNVVNLPAFTLGVKATEPASTAEKDAGNSKDGEPTESSTEATTTETASTQDKTETTTEESSTEAPMEYTVKFTDEDGTTPLKDKEGNVISEQKVKKGDKATKPTNDPIKENFRFVCWYDKEDNDKKEFKFDTQITKDITLAAKWQEEVTVTFDAKGGKLTGGNSVTIDKGSALSDKYPSDPVRDDYKFLGWFNGDTKYDEDTTIDKTITLEAKWEQVKFTVTFNANGGNLKGSSTVKVDKGKTITNPPTASKDGYRFLGWYQDKETTAFDFAKPVNSDLTLVAKWQEVVTVTFNAGEGKLDGEKSVTIDKGSTLSSKFPKAPTRDHYDFQGWFNGDKKYDKDTPIDKIITLEARWIPHSYKIEYKGLEGATFDESTKNPNKTTYTIEDNDITLKNPTKKGYTFLGWTEDSEEGEPNQNVIIKKGSTGNKTYWAHWKQNEIEVTVTGTYVYNEKPKQAEITVKDKETGETLKETEDYKVTYENNTDAGTATVTVTGKGSYEGKTGSGTFEIKKGKIEPKYAPVTAYCGQKLSDIVVQPDGVKGNFQWKYTDKYKKDTVMSEGAECTITATFEPENKNYESKDVTIVVKPVHDFGKLTNLEHQGANAVDNKKKKSGSREYYHCKACGKYYDENKKEQSQEYFIVPYVEKSITVTLGSGNTSISKYVKDGKEAVVSQVMKSSSTYKKYLTFDAKTGTIKTPKSKKYYKKKIKNPTIVVTDAAGEQYSVKVKLQITKPTVKVSKKSYTSVSGIKSYKYTIKCNANSADQFAITVASGLTKSSTKKSLNKALKKRCSSQFKKKKSKATVTVSFTIAQKSIKKKKLSFQVYAKYGSNKSAVREISK